ncbi:MAG: FAD-dependent oxidoreductase [Cyanobacteriota bacterium]|nr:FAD-dependent oxidoreductase [Cyanobacteriota bacterium]
MFDVVVIGAGIAGLTCAGQLARGGYRVAIVEKSRGVGGRAATRRLPGNPTPSNRADLGVPYLKAEGRLLSGFVRVLRDRGILTEWTRDLYRWDAENRCASPVREPRKPIYVAPEGISAIGKFLATDLEVWCDRRARTLSPGDGGWLIALDAPKNTPDLPFEIAARAIVVAIPAPQAIALLETREGAFLPLLSNLREIEYDPCYTVIAGYPQIRQPPWGAIDIPHHPQLRWLGLDSSKRTHPSKPVLVLHSSPEFARDNLEVKDLEPIGKALLSTASEMFELGLERSESEAEFVQVHRWRYAFPRTGKSQDCLGTLDPFPIVCCGDGFGPSRPQPLETALRSGLAAASLTNDRLSQFSLPAIEHCWEAIR